MRLFSVGMSNRDPAKADVLQGTLDLMVLQTLDTLGALHGYAIAARLEQVSGGALQLNMGTLYPALMRLEQRGLLRGKWALRTPIAMPGSTRSRRQAVVSSPGKDARGTGWRASSTRCSTARHEAGRSHADPSRMDSPS